MAKSPRLRIPTSCRLAYSYYSYTPARIFFVPYDILQNSQVILYNFSVQIIYMFITSRRRNASSFIYILFKSVKLTVYKWIKLSVTYYNPVFDVIRNIRFVYHLLFNHQSLLHCSHASQYNPARDFFHTNHYESEYLSSTNMCKVYLFLRGSTVELYLVGCFSPEEMICIVNHNYDKWFNCCNYALDFRSSELYL